MPPGNVGLLRTFTAADVFSKISQLIKCMAKVSRDVLIVSKLSYLSEQASEKEYVRVLPLLSRVETLQAACIATEVIDVARYKIIRKHSKILELLRQRSHKPFVFVFNKN
jgi:hypothetical protein